MYSIAKLSVLYDKISPDVIASVKVQIRNIMNNSVLLSGSCNGYPVTASIEKLISSFSDISSVNYDFYGFKCVPFTKDFIKAFPTLTAANSFYWLSPNILDK